MEGNLLEVLREAQDKGLSVAVIGEVEAQDGKEVLPVHHQDLWDMSADKPITCLITYSPSVKPNSRFITVGITSDRPLKAERIRFFSIAKSVATGFLKGIVGNLLMYDRQLGLEEMQQIGHWSTEQNKEKEVKHE